MKLDNRGFTLMELLAVIFVLGIIMAVTIPNIVGISTQNKTTAYAEDAKKFKNTVEYLLRGDSNYEKPVKNGDCVVVNLGYVHGSEYDNPPYGGRYLMQHSYVVMVKESDRYEYYVQLIEELPDSGDVGNEIDGYRGFKLRKFDSLEGARYLDNYQPYPGAAEESSPWESLSVTLPNEVKLGSDADAAAGVLAVCDTLTTDQKTYIKNRTGCAVEPVSPGDPPPIFKIYCST